MMKRSCIDCCFFQKTAGDLGDEGLGFCHRFPPKRLAMRRPDKIEMLLDAWAATDFPVVDGTLDWCGEFVSGEILAD